MLIISYKIKAVWRILKKNSQINDHWCYCSHEVPAKSRSGSQRGLVYIYIVFCTDLIEDHQTEMSDFFGRK